MNVLSPSIRLATPRDLPAIRDIYNHEILHSTCIWRSECVSLEERTHWLSAHGGQYPITVAESAGEIVAWGSISPLVARECWQNTVEDSVYVRADCQRRGLGRLILRDLITRGRSAGHRTIVGVISADQTASLKLHESLGFAYCGTIRQAGHKFGRWLDAVYMQIILSTDL